MTSDVRKLLDYVSHQLTLHRANRGLGLRAMSKEIGISFNTLSRIERKHAMTLENYIKITNWLSENGYLEPTNKKEQTQ